MRFQNLALLASTASSVVAFLSIGRSADAMKAESEKWHDQKRAAAKCPFADASDEVKRAEEAGCPFAAGKKQKKRAAAFDPVKQRVSVSGEHAFRAPDKSKGDQRGMFSSPRLVQILSDSSKVHVLA